MDMQRLVDNVNAVVGEACMEMTEGTANHRDLWARDCDIRAIPYQFWFNSEMLIVPNRFVSTLDYYGGFEYVKEEDGGRAVVGEYTVFSAIDGRVGRALAALNEVAYEDVDRDEE